MAQGNAVPAFTIASNNYLGMARTLVESYAEHHPDAPVWVCVVDRPSPELDYDSMPFQVVFAEDLGIPRFRNFAFRYDILELNTAVKPFVMKYLRDEKGCDRVFYFDPDILVTDRVATLEHALETHQAVVTPHLTQPLDNVFRPPERVIRMCGTYNLGFVGLRLDQNTETFLQWWCDRLHRYCINDVSNGMFVDQSWMDLTTSYLERVAVVRDPIFNVAYWNLPQRFPHERDGRWYIDDEPVGFFHFSGLDLDNLDIISKHQDRIDLWERPELRPLFEHYRDLIARSGQREVRHIEYAYHRFTGGDVDIPRCARKVIQEADPDARRWKDPFDVDGEDAFMDWFTRPVTVKGCTTSRAAVALWQSRVDLREAFPDPLGGSAGDLAGWFVHEGAAQSGFHPRLVEDLRQALVRAEPAPAPDVWPWDLADPGDATAWLNELAEGAPTSGPRITRLALEIHRRRADVREAYPDPLGRDRDAFAYWFVLCGRVNEGLHPDLVLPVRRSLGLGTRISLKLKGVVSDGRGGGVPESRPAAVGGTAAEVAPAKGVPEPCDGVVGVNLVGLFHGEAGAGSFASDIDAWLADAGVGVARVGVDHPLPELMTSDEIRHPEGAPFATTVLALRSARWRGAVESLPRTVRAGGRVVGMVTEPVDAVDPDGLGVATELWVPDEGTRSAVTRVFAGPVAVVPLAPPGWEIDRFMDSIDLDPERMWIATTGRVESGLLNKGASTVVEALRRLDDATRNALGICLVAGPGGDSLQDELAHLPVVVVPRPPRPGTLAMVADSCDGWIELDPSTPMQPVHLLVRQRGKVMLGGAWNPSGGQPNASLGMRDGEAGVDAGVRLLREAVTRRGSDLSVAEETVDPSALADAWRSAVEGRGSGRTTGGGGKA